MLSPCAISASGTQLFMSLSPKNTQAAVRLDEELNDRVSLSYYAIPIFNLYSKTAVLIMSSYQKINFDP